MMRKAVILAFCWTGLCIGQTNKPWFGQVLNREHFLGRGVLSAYPMIEGCGPLYDRSFYRNTGTWTGTQDWSTGQYGYQIRTDNDQYIVFANQISAISPSRFSVFWIGTPVQLSSSRRYFYVGQYSQLAGANYDWGLTISSTYKVTLAVNDGGASTTTTTSLVVGTRTCICATYDGSYLRIYCNGVPEGTPAGYSTAIQARYPFRIGYYYTNNTGLWADVKTETLYIYDRALTYAEQLSLFQNPYCMFEAPATLLPAGATPAQVIMVSVETSRPQDIFYRGRFYL